MTLKGTPEKLTAFCAALAETCNVGKACAAVGICRTTAYRWRDDDKLFAAQWDQAVRIGVTALEDEASRRAFEGMNEPLTHQGQFTYLYETRKDADGDDILDPISNTPKMFPVLDDHGKPRVATIKKYSDTLAIFLLKAHNPDKYRENSKIELAGQVDVVNTLLQARKRSGRSG